MKPQLFPDWLKNDFLQVVDNVWSQFHLLAPDRPLPKLIKKVSPGQQFTAEIQVVDDVVIARFREGCFEKLYAAIESCEIALVAAVTHDLEDLFSPAMEIGDIGGVIHAIATHFVLAHELSHVLCGHLDHPPAKMVEGLSAPRELKTDPTATMYYVTEMEADNTGLEVLLYEMSFEGLNLLLNSTDFGEDTATGTIDDLMENNRIIGYRCLLAAAWIVVGLFEQDYQQHKRDENQYPLPGARLFACVDTILRSFIAFDNIRYDDGGLHAILSDQDIDRLKQFLHKVLKPVALALAEIPDKSTSLQLLSAGSQAFETAEPPVVTFARDVGGLLLDQPLFTEGAKELLALQPWRAFVNEQLLPFRYLKGMSNV